MKARMLVAGTLVYGDVWSNARIGGGQRRGGI
jgi:hypothetical protein